MRKMIFKTISPALRRTTRLAYIVATCLTLAACSSAPTSVSLPPASHAYGPFEYKQAELDKLLQWDVEGKLAVYANNKNTSGLLSWHQRSDRFDLLISGPLGSGQLHVKGTPGLATATSSKGQMQAESVETLFAQEFGWSFPMQELNYWVRGIPHPNSEATLSYNESGEAATISQAGWQVKYYSYNKITGLPMPKKMQITGPDVRLVLVLNSWVNLYPFPRLNPSYKPL
jgi:outer membrane lipoprotein LolB